MSVLRVPQMFWCVYAAVLALVAVAVSAAQAQVSAEMCGPLHVPPAAPPWDYRTDKYFLPIVENAHFTPAVEALIRGKSTSHIAGDIHYTLGRFPNHPRALIAITRIASRDQNNPRNKLILPLECYYERAIRFKGDDALVRMLYARFLAGANRRPEAIFQLETAARLAGDSPMTHQNVGLVYMEMKEYERALAQAYLVHRLDPNERNLRDALVAAGQWKDAPPSAPEPSASTPTASAGAASAPVGPAQ